MNDRHALGREMLQFVVAHINRFLAYRDSVGGNEGIVDVDYDRLIADPVSAVAEIYERTGMTMPSTVRARLAAWIGVNPKGKRGRHEYRLADYGLDAGTLTEAFTDYCRRFGVRPEGSP